MKSKLSPIIAIAATGFSCSVVLSFSAFDSAQALSFTPFSFTTNFSTSGAFDPTQDVRLDSVVVGGNSLSKFELVNSAKIISNSQNLLASVRGPNTPQDPLVGEGPQTDSPTDADITASLGNLNLSSLVNTAEFSGTAVVDVFFNNPVSNFFFWERGGMPGHGGNSDLLVEALSADGTTVLASYKILRANYTDAGYSLISTSGPGFITGEQGVGSIGLRLDGATTTRLRLTSFEPDDNGPDFKVVAEAIPESSSTLGLLILGVASVSSTLKKKWEASQRSD
jgi:hypothetical protein